MLHQGHIKIINMAIAILIIILNKKTISSNMMMMITKTRRIYQRRIYLLMMMMRECFCERAVELQERICIWFEGKLSLGAFSQNIQFAPQPCMKGFVKWFPSQISQSVRHRAVWYYGGRNIWNYRPTTTRGLKLGRSASIAQISSEFEAGEFPENCFTVWQLLANYTGSGFNAVFDPMMRRHWWSSFTSLGKLPATIEVSDEKALMI